MNRHLASWLRPLHLPWLLPWLLGLLLALSPLSAPATPGPSQPNGATLEVFVREGCPHCTQAKAFLPELQRQHPDLIIRLRPLDTDPTALADLQHHAARGCPPLCWGTGFWWDSTGRRDEAGSYWS
ncbi:hypothetical protein KBY57_05480 [Cyanobium sp. Aljojuca 7D2]|uniref:DsbA family protein n=1 Tax=Cyanobium sp. Aljojuca 7D2 TaxID=2823698 RepID=UPI0020CD234A|nr:DsbA family protein [Cyanobium sp. Aljojuca 7D2]MCP9890508.1 hypothetical protein [Cyanobium sp. Aljojuca 7D2]